MIFKSYTGLVFCVYLTIKKEEKKTTLRKEIW